jgi:hypothetical protein
LIIQLYQQQANLIFIDEAVFSSKQVRSKCWAKSEGMPLLVDKKKLGFKAIAVVAGIDIRGKVVAITMREKSICNPDFCNF